ncbi:type II toxin-antitoxin system RelE/ParE family toxin [Candidatus Entotheonella palauensis]|uniref:Toxin n=1 Tax=Candidatus Entotheonella gemina TaxID=1429439 RepID=W4MCZ6_9BACT|nr:type II toxin-antitoxin system RelE/ParE family toxin [Candidatus Entotheonella palauensis]ETX07502.1 MAG: plasmid stabilization protein [Candidatus Entotheonella gemina]
MADFRITPRAREDLRAIGRYTLRVWGRRQRDIYLRELDRRFQWLADNPRLGKHRPDIHEGYYSFLQGAHLVFYLIREGRIDIIGVPHQNMDIEGYFET